MNMNESISKDDQGAEEQNNSSSGGKPGSYNSNSNSAQRKKSYSTTKPTEYSLPKEQPESTSKNLETKAKNILLPWKKKHNKDSENTSTGTAAIASHHANVGPDVNHISNDPKLSSDPNATHGYSYVKTTTPAASPEHSKVKTSHSVNDHRSNVKTSSPTIHENYTIGTGKPGVATAHGHISSKNRTTKHEHSSVNSGSSGTTATHGHSNSEASSPTNISEYRKTSTGPSATAATHGHTNVKSTTVPTASHAHSKANSNSGNIDATASNDHGGVNNTYSSTHAYSNSSTSPKATNISHHRSAPKTVPSTAYGHSKAEENYSAPQGYSNFDSSSDRDAIPGSFRGMAGGDLSSVDPSVYTDSSPKSTERTPTSHYGATGPPQDTMKEIAENVKMNESEQTGLKNDQISGSDAIQQQTMDPKYERTMGVSSGLSSHQPPSYNDDSKNIQYPEKTKVEKQNITEKASEKFRSERDDILDSGDHYQEKNIKSKPASNWGPIEYSSGTGKNENLQDVVLPPGVKGDSHNVTSVPQHDYKMHTNLERAHYDDDDVKGIKNDSLQDVFGSQTADRNVDNSRGNEGHWSGVSKGSTTNQNIAVPPAMKNKEDLNKGSTTTTYSKPHQYGLDYLDDVEDYNKIDIDEHSNVKDELLQGKPFNYGYDDKQQVLGTSEVDALSNSVRTQDENLISPKQTIQTGMKTAGDESPGGYEYSNMSDISKISDLSKNKSGPTPTRSNFIDQIEPRRAKTTENITSNSEDSNNREPSNSGTVGTGKEGIRSKTFSSATFDNSKSSDANHKNYDVTSFDDGRTADTNDAATAAYDNTDSRNFETAGLENTGSTYANSKDTAGVIYDRQRPSEEKSTDHNGHNILSQENYSDDDIDVNKNAKVLEKDALGYKRKVDLKNKRRTDIGGSDAADTYAAEVGNFPSLIDPRVPTYGFKDDDNTSSSQKTPLSSTSETADPEPATYLIHNETTSQGRKVSVGSAGSEKLKHHHNHSHHHSRQSSSKASDYEYNSNHSTEHTPRHHRSDSNKGEQDFENGEDKEQTGKQSFMGRVRNSISGGTFGFRSEI